MRNINIRDIEDSIILKEERKNPDKKLGGLSGRVSERTCNRQIELFCSRRFKRESLDTKKGSLYE